MAEDDPSTQVCSLDDVWDGANQSFAPQPVGSPTLTCPLAPEDAPAPPTYEPAKWNNPPIKNSNNCYSYASNDPDNHPPGKPQPGEKCGHPLTEETCAEVPRPSKCA